VVKIVEEKKLTLTVVWIAERAEFLNLKIVNIIVTLSGKRILYSRNEFYKDNFNGDCAILEQNKSTWEFPPSQKSYHRSKGSLFGCNKLCIP
jgi:hypothetical protein